MGGVEILDFFRASGFEPDLSGFAWELSDMTLEMVMSGGGGTGGCAMILEGTCISPTLSLGMEEEKRLDPQRARTSARRKSITSESRGPHFQLVIWLVIQVLIPFF